MNTASQWALIASGLLAAGLWLMLPRGAKRGRRLGLVLTLAACGAFGAAAPQVGGWGLQTVFYVLAGVTVISAACTVTFRNPVYSAIWFALSLLGTAALFMVQGAQFLGVATIVVYAGAILVTFLFVLMLSNPSGMAYYDRLSWESFLSALTGAGLIGAVTVALCRGFSAPAGESLVSAPPVDDPRGVLSSQHVEHLGRELFSRHLVSVEVAGTLLLVALVGAAAIVTREKLDRRRTAA